MATAMEMPTSGHPATASTLNVGRDHAGPMQAAQGSSWKHPAAADAAHNPEKDLRRANTVAQGRDISSSIPPRGPAQARTKSLRRVKNSKEALALPLALPKEADVTPDPLATGREPRHFTVGNVGNNGKIYLRYALPRGQPIGDESS